jgi:hypothetical protein
LKSNSSLFIFKYASVTILALVYADDIIFIGSHFDAITKLIQTLSCDFSVKDLGDQQNEVILSNRMKPVTHQHFAMLS